MKPQFSILMANYNNSHFLSQAIESVLCQTFNDWELIIVDDSSTDNSLQIIKPYLRDKRIHLFKHQSNQGYIHTLISCLSHARSTIVGILDSDDALLPTAITKALELHRTHPEASLVYTNFWYCNDLLVRYQLGPCRAIAPSSTNLRDDCVSHFKTFKRAAYDQTTGFEPAMLAGEDFDLITKLEEVGKLLFVSEPLFLYRVHHQSLTHQNSYNITGQLSVMRIKYQAYIRRLGTNIPNLTRAEVVKILTQGIWYSLTHFRFQDTRYFIKAFYDT